MTASVRALFPAGASATTTGSGVNSITTSVTIVADDVLAVHTVYNDGTDTGATLACKLDPTGANLSPDGASAVVHSNNQTAGYEQVFYYLNPPVGTFNVTVTQTGGTPDGMEQKCLAVAGTTRQAPTITTFAPAGTGNNTAVTITAPSFFRGVVTGHYCAGSAFSSTGQTQLYVAQNPVNLAAANSVAGNVAAGTGNNVTLTATIAADWYAAIALSWDAVDEPVWAHWKLTPPGIRSPGSGRFLPGLRGPAPEVITKLDLRSNNADGTSYPSNTFTPTPGRLLFVMVHGGGSVATDTTLAASANGITFTPVADLVQALSGNISAWFVADQLTPASPVPMTVTWDCTSDPATGAFIVVAEVDDISRTGLDAIKQTALNANIAANGPYTATFSTAVNPSNPVLGMVGYNGGLSITEPPQWFEIDEPPDMTLPTQGFEWAKRDYGETGTVMTWTASAATVRANVGAVEFDMSPPSGGGLTSVTSTRATSWDTLAIVQAPSYDATITALSPVARYKFDDTTGTSAVESIAGTNPGTYVGTPTLGATGLVSDGGTAVTTTSSSEITIPGNTLGVGTTGTMLMWWKGTSGAAIWGSNSTLSANRWLFTATGANPTLQVQSTTQTITTIASSALLDGNRHLIGVSSDGTNWELCIDGVSKWTWTQAVNFNFALNAVPPLHLGRASSSGAFGPGTYDELAFVNSVVSAASQATLFSAGTGTGAVTRATTWNTLASVASTRATTWGTLTNATSTRATTWTTRAAVLSTRATTWNTAASVVATRATTWNTAASVVSTRATTWNVAASVSSTRATTWNTLESVASTRATSWNVLTSLTQVTSTRATTWDTLAAVASTRATTWNVSASVTSTRATSWTTLASVTSSRATTWNTRAAVTSTRATTWNTAATVTSTRATTWRTLALVTSTRATSWTTLASVTSTRATTWNVAANLVSVTSTRATTWNVIGLVTSTRATTWTTRALVTSTRATTWSVLSSTTSTRATTWSTLALVLSSRATSWWTLQAVTSTRATQWDVFSTLVPGIPVANPVLTLTTTDSILTLTVAAAGVLTVTDTLGVLTLTDGLPPTLTVAQPNADLTLTGA